MSVAAPIDVARAMHAKGAHREAELVLRATAVRDAMDGECRIALRALHVDGRLPPGPLPELHLGVVDEWIRHGMLVEALALLAGVNLEGPAREWADLLGELLAPVPAHAEACFVSMHRQLLSGGVSVALAIVEDRLQQGPVPTWAQRRLDLLRWMLLDNAQTMEEEETPEAPSELAAVLQGPLSRRDLQGAFEAVKEFAREHPTNADARDSARMLELLVEEMIAGVSDQDVTVHTVPVFGRPAATMQLRMANLEGAFSIYEKLTMTQPGDPAVRALHEAVRGIRRVLTGRSPVDRSFAPPPREDLEQELGLIPAFADKTAVKSARKVLEQVRADSEVTRIVDDPLAAYLEETRAIVDPAPTSVDPTLDLPAKQASSQTSTKLEASSLFEDETRPAGEGELPLAAFEDEATFAGKRPRRDTEKDESRLPDAPQFPFPPREEAKTLVFERKPPESELDFGDDTAIDMWDTERLDVSEVRAKSLDDPVASPSPSPSPESEAPPEAFETLKDPPTVIVQRIKGVGGSDG